MAMAKGGAGAKDASGDVLMGALATDPEAATWELRERLVNALNALGKGGKGAKGFPKGGRGSPKGGKGGSLGGQGTSAAAPGSGPLTGISGAFSGACHHCGVTGHRRRDCPHSELSEAAARKKGAGKGGKNAKILEVGAEDPPEPPLPSSGADDAEGADWYFENLASVRVRPAAPPAGARLPQSEAWGSPNRFAALEDDMPDLDDDDAWEEVPKRHQHPISTQLPPAGSARKGLRGPRPQGKPRRVAAFGGGLSVLLRDSDDGIFAVSAGSPTDERVIEVVVDSGAVQSVAPPGLFPGTVVPSEMSRAGRTFRAANGSRIRNLGQLRVSFTSTEGHKCSLPFQVAEVEHALLSVSHLTRAGNVVELTAEGGRISNATTGKSMALARRGGIYALPLRFAGFPRQGAR